MAEKLLVLVFWPKISNFNAGRYFFMKRFVKGNTSKKLKIELLPFPIWQKIELIWQHLT